MKRNLTRETRHDEDSLTTLHHLKEEMESKQGEILVLQNESQWSNVLKVETESKHGELLPLKDKLQGAKTVLLNFHKKIFLERVQEVIEIFGSNLIAKPLQNVFSENNFSKGNPKIFFLGG